MKKVDVVIIGAGASGLQCASTLLHSDRNPSFLVLEARDRVGGRIHSRKEEARTTNGSESMSYIRDLGAAWVHGTGSTHDENPMMSLLEQTTPEGRSVSDHHLLPIFDGNCWTRPNTMLQKSNKIAMFYQGKIIPNDSSEMEEAMQKFFSIQHDLAKYSNQLFETSEGMKTVSMSISSARMVVNSTKCAIDSNAESSMVDDIVPFYDFLHQNWNGLSDSDLQLSSIGLPQMPMETDELYEGEGDYEGPHCKLKHGMIKVLEPLHRDVVHHIALNEQVIQIRQVDDRKVQVDTLSGMRVEAKCCVSTLPLGCLQHNMMDMFKPSLSAEITEAINSIATVYYKKVFLTFDDIFWPTQIPVLGLIHSKGSFSEIGQHLLLYNFWAKDGMPCLEAVLCGDAGKWAVGRSDTEIRDVVLRFMENVMGFENLHEKCLDCHITRWEEDPFTLGPYSSFRIGTLERHIDSLTVPQWDGSLVFTGEHTESEHQGSVQAALMSGKRAANQAIDALKNKKGAQTMSATLLNFDGRTPVEIS